MPTTTRIALISMPWQDPFSPSVQLGALTGWIEKHRDDVQVDTYELYLDLADAIGMQLAKRISISWIGEALFAYILFPSQALAISSYLENARKDDEAFLQVNFGSLIERLRTRLLDRLDEVDWSKYCLVGLSVVFAQTMSSILTAREIKRRAPNTPIVFGGPSCTNLLGKSLLETFPFIDYVVNGEGERPLLHLVEALEQTGGALPGTIPGVVHRNSPTEAFNTIDQVKDMSQIPLPNYDGYFRTLKRLGGSNETVGRIRIPVETSRGCWWDRSHIDPMLSCMFCNLNLQWFGYREKPVRQALDEILQLGEKYKCPDFTIVDNILRYREATAFIQGLKDMEAGFDFWMEARVSVKPSQIRQLRECGGRVIQFGIEALSSAILRKIVKGTTTIQNLQAMKFCEQYDVKNTANLIVDLPGVEKEDILETLDNIEFARGYRPLDIADFSLVYQAPAYKDPERFGITNIRNYHMYALLIPPELNQRLFLTEKSFDSQALDDLRPLWSKVRQLVREWHEHYERMQPNVEGKLLLSFQDGITFLKVRDFRHIEPRFYWLHGVERDLYLECSHITQITDLYHCFPTLDQATINSLLQKWHDQKLLFLEGKQALALAVAWGPVSDKRSLCPVRQPRIALENA